MERRRFIVKAGGTLAAIGAAVVVDAPTVIAQPKIQWRMSTAFAPSLDMHHRAAQQLGRMVDEMSAGRFRIEVRDGGEIMPPFECFDAASKGTIEAFMASPQYWTSKEPALEWFGTIPFGMNPYGMAAWFYQGDGLKLMEEGYAAFNLVPRPGFPVAPQMGGWFRKKITTLADFKGLRMRIPNLGGKVIARAGGTTVLTPGGDIYSGFLGYLDSKGPEATHDDGELRRAMTYGSVLASFNVEEFGTERVRRLTRGEIDDRFAEFKHMTTFDAPA